MNNSSTQSQSVRTKSEDKEHFDNFLEKYFDNLALILLQVIFIVIALFMAKFAEIITTEENPNGTYGIFRSFEIMFVMMFFALISIFRAILLKGSYEDTNTYKDHFSSKISLNLHYGIIFSFFIPVYFVLIQSSTARENRIDADRSIIKTLEPQIFFLGLLFLYFIIFYTNHFKSNLMIIQRGHWILALLIGISGTIYTYWWNTEYGRRADETYIFPKETFWVLAIGTLSLAFGPILLVKICNKIPCDKFNILNKLKKDDKKEDKKKVERR